MEVYLYVPHVCSPYAVHTSAIHRRIELITARTWDVRYAYATCAVDMQWSGSHMRHHMQWHRHSCAKCAACVLRMRHWYAVDTHHMWNSSAGDVPSNYLGDLTAFRFIFSYVVWAQWHRQPVEQGHMATLRWYIWMETYWRFRVIPFYKEKNTQCKLWNLLPLFFVVWFSWLAMILFRVLNLALNKIR